MTFNCDIICLTRDEATLFNALSFQKMQNCLFSVALKVNEQQDNKMGGECAVAHCKSYYRKSKGSNVIYHRLKKIWKEWTIKCKRAEHVNILD